MSETKDNPVDHAVAARDKRLANMRGAPRCGAKNRAGNPCQAAAIRGKKRCRLHGGAAGSGAPSGSANGRYTTGRFTKDAVEFNRKARSWMRQAKRIAREIE